MGILPADPVKGGGARSTPSQSALVIVNQRPDGEQRSEVPPGDVPEDRGLPADGQRSPGGERTEHQGGH